MRNRYNFYYNMPRAAAGDPPSGAADETVIDDGSDTSNGKTINANDPEDPPKPEAKTDDPEGDDKKVDDVKTEDPPALKPSVVPRDAMLKRVGELTRDKTSLKTENERLKAELAAKAVAPVEGDDPPDRAEFKSKAEFDAAVEAVAEKKAQDKVAADRQKVADQEFTKRCNAVADIGEKDFKDDWTESVANLRMLSDDGNIPKLLLDAALEADLPAQALHFLGQNPDKAMEIMALPPLKQVVEITKLGIKKAGPAPKPKTGAPDPIDPLNGGGGAGDNAGLGDEIDDETWLANRQAEVRANALGAAKR